MPAPAPPLFGSHLSVAGGLHRAATRAGELGLGTVQIFTKSNHRWAAKPLTDAIVGEWNEAVAAAGLRSPCAHASYLINFATPDDDLRAKSADAYAEELRRAERLGLAGVVVHPGSHVGAGEEVGLANIAAALAGVLAETDDLTCEVWLETTAGQGTSLGHRFEHLGTILATLPDDRRVGVCVDTCHIHAAGYDYDTAAKWAAVAKEFEEHVGFSRLRCLHVNDSKKPLGSRVDRHEHIAAGTVGVGAFRHLLTDPRVAGLPAIMETPKGDREPDGDGGEAEPWDAVNLRLLRELAGVTHGV